MAHSNEFQITGHYLGHTSGFNSGVANPASYNDTIAHLREVLAAATPGGNPHWGNKGVQIMSWTFPDGTRFGSFQLHTVEDLDRSISTVVDRPGYVPLPASPTERKWS